MFIQLWNSLLEKLKTTKQKIIYTNVTKDISMKKKNDKKTLNITIAESTENVYHFTRQNLILLMLPSTKTKIKNGS